MHITEQDFVNIIRENEDRLRHLARVYTDRKADQEDLFQEILIQVWQSLSSFEGDAKIGTWIYRLAVNTAISFVRKKNTRKGYYSEYRKEKRAAKGNQQIDPQSSEEGEQLAKLYNVISTLNPSEKAIITMYLEGFSYAEIAYVTDITENYVGVKLNRIKKKLSKKVGGNNGT